MTRNPTIGISRRSIELGIAELKAQGLIIRKGSRKSGYWEINKEKSQ